MRTVIEAHELLPKGLQLENLGIETGRVSISMSSGSRKCVCPSCGRDSSRVHSRYSRTVSDLPWHGVSVELEVRARRFFCDEASCERRIFCERLPYVAARARKTRRLEGALLAIVLELGGRAGARLATELGLVVGRDALLRRAKGAPLPDGGKVRALGVDDFAFKKGHNYGTVLVDLERRRAVDLLPERSQESLVAWLKRHPEVEIATRDRSNIYREALAKGAPEAVQVADRWHLLHNLAQTLEEFLLQKGPAMREVATPSTGPEEKDDGALAPGPMSPNRPRTHDAKMEEAARKRHERLVQQWRDIRRLYLAGADLRHICHRLGISARTVYRYKDLTEPPPRRAHGRRASVPDPYVPYLGATLERGLPQRQASVPRDPGAGLRQQRGDVRPVPRPAPPRRGPRETALLRAAGQEGLRGGALSHPQERGGAVRAPRREAHGGAEGVHTKALRRRRSTRRRAQADPGVFGDGPEPRRREARQVARRSGGVQGLGDGELRRGLKEDLAAVRAG